MRSQGRRTRRNRYIHADHSQRFTRLQSLEPRLLMSVAPTAVDDFASTEPGTAVQIDVLANDSDDTPIDPFAVTIISGASFGFAFLDWDTGLVNYIPNDGFTGVDTFGYVISDMDGNISAEAIVTVNVGIPDNPTPNKEDATFDLPSGFFNGAITLKQNGENLDIMNSLTGELLASMAMSSLNSLTIDASDHKGPLHLNLDFSGGTFELDGGLHIIGSNSRRPDKVLITATGAEDSVTVDGNLVMVNGLTVELSSIEKLKIRTSDHMQVYHAKHCHKPMALCDALISFSSKGKGHLKHA